MGIMTEKQRTRKEQEAFDALLGNLNITDRETPIKHSKQKTLGATAMKSKRRKGKGKR